MFAPTFFASCPGQFNDNPGPFLFQALDRELADHTSALLPVPRGEREPREPALGGVYKLVAVRDDGKWMDELRKKGVINDAEFAAKKDDLLKRM